MLAPGSLIDNRYEILAPLAQGGMGAVYRARRTLLGDEVAIKVVLQDAPDLASRERFLFIGTVTYAAPEQLSGRDVDARGDIYSLAAVVFEMLTGRAPFEGRDLMAIVTAQMTGEVPRARKVRPDLPDPLDAAIGRALAKNPDERWQSAAAFGAALCPSNSPSISVGPPAAASKLSSTYEVLSPRTPVLSSSTER